MSEAKEEVSAESVDNILKQLDSAENDVLRMMDIFQASMGIIASAPIESAQNMQPLIAEYSQLRSELHKKLMDSSKVLLMTPTAIDSGSQHLEAVERASFPTTSK